MEVLSSGPDCIPVVVLKNCETKLLYAEAEFFDVCLKESYFPDYCSLIDGACI